MAPEELGKVLQSHQVWLTSGYKEGERANLEGADLQEVDLRNAYLSEAKFKNARMRQMTIKRLVLLVALLSV
jgi:uncharacterized protein YjbI with pentapeptide repeats